MRKFKFHTETEKRHTSPAAEVTVPPAGVCTFEFSSEQRPDATVWYLAVQPYGPWWYCAAAPWDNFSWDNFSFVDIAQQLKAYFQAFAACGHEWGPIRVTRDRHCPRCNSYMIAIWPEFGYNGMTLECSIDTAIRTFLSAGFPG